MAHIIIVRSHYPDRRIEKEIDSLIKGGHAITLLAWDRGRYKQLVAPTGYRVKKLKLSVPSGSIKVAAFLPIWWLFVVMQLIMEKYTCIHAVDFDSFLPSIAMARIRRSPIVYDILDFYADTIAFPIAPKITSKIISKIDKILMKFAGAVIIADETRREQIGKDANRNVVVMNNSPKINSLNHTPVNKSDDNAFRIFFGGAVASDRHIDTMISAVRDLDGIKLTIMGYCDPEIYEGELRKITENAANIEIHLKAVPYEEIIRQSINADLLFALYDPSIPNNKYASPNKLFEAMMCGKPIIVSEGTSMANIIEKYANGLVVPCDDIDAIKEAVLRLKNDTRLRQILGENGRKAFDSFYNWEIMEKRLLNVYDKLITSP